MRVGACGFDRRLYVARRFGVCLATAASLCWPAELPGQAATPEAAARQMMNAVRAADWDGMAAMMHPDALAELRGFLEPLLELPAAAEFRQAVLGVATDSAARGLSDEEVFAGFVRFAMTRDPEMVPSMRTAELQVLGHLMEGQTAHVVSRVTISYQGITISQMEVSSFREVDGQWRGLLSGDISALAKALRDAVQGGAG